MRTYESKALIYKVITCLIDEVDITLYKVFEKRYFYKIFDNVIFYLCRRSYQIYLQVKKTLWLNICHTAGTRIDGGCSVYVNNCYKTIVKLWICDIVWNNGRKNRLVKVVWIQQY